MDLKKNKNIYLPLMALFIVSSMVLFWAISMTEKDYTMERENIGLSNTHNEIEADSVDLIEQSANNSEQLSARIAALENSAKTTTETLNDLLTLVESIASNDQYLDNISNDSDSKVNRLEISQEEKDYLSQQKLSYLEDLVNNPNVNDPSWAPIMEDKLGQLFTNNTALKVASSNNVQCGSSVCKVSATLPPGLDTVATSEFMWSLTMKLGRDLPRGTSGSVITNKDGSKEMVYYFMDKNVALPTSDQG